MATVSLNGRTPETVRREIEAERRELASCGRAAARGARRGRRTSPGSCARDLPVVAAGALGAGFFLAGGIGATMRFLARKGRER